MAGDLYKLLELPPDADADDIDRAYWAHARALSAASRFDHRASAKLDELNEAFQAFTKSETLRTRKRQRARREQLRRRLMRTAVVVALAGSATLAGWSLRSEIAALGADTNDAVQSAAGDAADWLRALDETPTAGSFYVIANTGGQGAFIRTAPSYDAPGVVAHPDGTGVAALGEHADAEGETWLKVQDAHGNAGWISERWLSPVR